MVPGTGVRAVFLSSAKIKDLFSIFFLTSFDLIIQVYCFGIGKLYGDYFSPKLFLNQCETEALRAE